MAQATEALAGVNLLGGLYQAKEAGAAGRIQSQAANQAADSAQAQLGQIKGMEQPYMDAGGAGLTRLADMLGTSGNTGAAGYGSLTRGFTNADLNANLAPNYDFMLKQGLGQAQNEFNASGGLIGGNAMQGLNTYAQNYAQNAYQQAYNNWQGNQQNIFSRLSDIAGMGQNATNSYGNFAAGLTGAANDYRTSGAAARAAGLVGRANALAGAFGNAAGMAALPSFITQMNSLGQAGSAGAGLAGSAGADASALAAVPPIA